MPRVALTVASTCDAGEEARAASWTELHSTEKIQQAARRAASASNERSHLLEPLGSPLSVEPRQYDNTLSAGLPEPHSRDPAAHPGECSAAPNRR